MEPLTHVDLTIAALYERLGEEETALSLHQTRIADIKSRLSGFESERARLLGATAILPHQREEPEHGAAKVC